MGATPQFSSTVLVGHATPSATADANYGAVQPTHAVLMVTGGTNGTKIEEIDVVGSGVTVAGNMNIFMYDGVTYWLLDTFLVTVITPSTTVSPYFSAHTYSNLLVPSGSFLYISSAVASQVAIVNAFGGSF
jgi:hypothetical protein